MPYAYYAKHGEMAHGLKKEEFELLSLCDGLHDIEENELTKSLVARRMIFPVEWKLKKTVKKKRSLYHEI